MCIYCRLISIYQSYPPSWYRHRFITSDSISSLRERSGFLLTKEWILKINALEPKHWRPVIIFYTFFKLALFLVKKFLVRLNSPISSFLCVKPDESAPTIMGCGKRESKFFSDRFWLLVGGQNNPLFFQDLVILSP